MTYYTQTNKIDEFVECFGVALEHLSTEDKLSLRAVSAYWARSSPGESGNGRLRIQS